MRCAVLYNRVKVLEFLDSQKETDLLCWYWEPALVHLAVQRVDPVPQVLLWLYNQLPHNPSPF